MAFERTLVLVKPHAVAERWTNPIFQRYLEAGLKFGDMQVLTLTRDEASAFYAEHEGKDFFEGLLDAMCAGPIVAMIWVGDNVIQQVRDLNGATRIRKKLNLARSGATLRVQEVRSTRSMVPIVAKRLSEKLASFSVTDHPYTARSAPSPARMMVSGCFLFNDHFLNFPVTWRGPFTAIVFEMKDPVSPDICTKAIL